MYKSKEELLKMTKEQITNYIEWLEKNDPIARVGGLEYIEWGGGELMEALEELGIDELF